MSERRRTFSEFWYRIASQQVALRPQVRVHRQYWRGEPWFLLEDPFNNQFHRVRPAAWDFLVRLRPGRTVQQAWEECLEEHPDDAPGQEDALHLLAQLYAANLLHFDLPPESEKFFERYRKRRDREQRSVWLNLMFAKFPLWDPDAFLRRLMPLARVCFSPAGFAAWLAAVIWAVKIGLDHWDALREQTQSVLAPGNLFLLYVGMALVKAVHEIGHALACRRYGGEVHTMGIMLLIFTPVPYVDVTSSWAFRERHRRVWVAAAGMMSELLVAAGAMAVWAATGPGIVHSLAYNMIFIASVSSLLFNGNPLLRYDAYYILSDLLDLPNLYARSARQLRWLAERYLFGRRAAHSPAQGVGEGMWLAAYGVLSGAYRLVVFSAMILFIAQRYLVAGAVMGAVCVVSWILVPAGRLAAYLVSGPAIERRRPRAVGVTAALAAAAIALLGLIPFPHRFLAPGIVQAVDRAEVLNATAGRLAEILTPSGASVTNGQPLARLADEDLDHQIAAAGAGLEQSLALQRKALQEATEDLETLGRYIGAVQARLGRLREDRSNLVVRAPMAGVWFAPELADAAGLRFARGDRLGVVADPAAYRFSAIVSQAEASRLFDGGLRRSEVRLKGRAGAPLAVDAQAILPAQRERLPSAALGWRGGGDVQVSWTDAEGTKTAEPFFEVRAAVRPRPDVRLLEGRTGRICFTLAPEPLAEQWLRRLRQTLRKDRGG